MKKNSTALFLIVSVVLCCLGQSVEAANYTYSSSQSSTINSKTFAAGDVVILQNGDWSNKNNITIKGTGTASAPILVKAETAGSVIFKGSSRLTIDGKYIEVEGVVFSGNSTVGTNHVVTFSKSSSYCRLTNSAIQNYNPSAQSSWATTDNKWVSINGTYNRVDHCYFENKANMGTLLVVWLVSGQSAHHRIDNNHFYKRIPLLDNNNKELNGQETIRIGDSNTSMTNANCTIENNFFEECDGEIEIISNKSCGNLYRNNVFYNNNGTLTLRHGNACIVSGNYFIGKNQSGTGGVRIIGESHKVYNNYFQDLLGSGYRTAVCVIKGKTNSALNEYFQVKNALIAFNTLYNCANGFNVGYEGGNDLVPVSTTIAHNVIFAKNNNQVGVRISDSKSEITWTNNLMYQGKHTSFSPTDVQFRRTTTNLNFQSMNAEYGIYQPTSSSMIAIQYKTTDYSEINTDIEGRLRPSEKMIGAFELMGNAALAMPTPETVGCSFINIGTGIENVKEHKALVSRMNISGNKLHIQSSVNRLVLNIYNLKGVIKSSRSAETFDGNFTFDLPTDLTGLHLFVFETENAKDTRKVIVP